MTHAERLSRISLFRWRFEWLALVLVAVSIVFSEQAREQRGRDPYLILHTGQSATATVTAGSVERQIVSPRWTRNRQELRPFIDISWVDRTGERRSAERYLLDVETTLALGIDPFEPKWPTEVRILYLDRPPDPSTETRPLPPATYQRFCRPRESCRVLVLAPGGRTQAEIDAELADYLTDWAPRGLWLGLAAFLGLLGLRLGGIIDSRPTLE